MLAASSSPDSGKDKDEARSAEGASVDSQRATRRPSDVAAHGETDSGSFSFRREAKSKDIVAELFRDPRPVVVDGQMNLMFGRLDVQSNPPAMPEVGQRLGGVQQQVDDDLSELRGVDRHLCGARFQADDQIGDLLHPGAHDLRRRANHVLHAARTGSRAGRAEPLRHRPKLLEGEKDFSLGFDDDLEASGHTRIHLVHQRQELFEPFFGRELRRCDEVPHFVEDLDGDSLRDPRRASVQEIHPQLTSLTPLAKRFAALLDSLDQGLRPEWLCQVEGDLALVDGCFGSSDIRVRRKDDTNCVRANSARGFADLHTGHAGETLVGYEDGDVVLLEKLQGLLSGGGGEQRHPWREDERNGPKDRDVVVHAEHRVVGFGAHVSASRLARREAS